MVISQVNKECEVMMEQLEVKVTREIEVILVPKEILALGYEISVIYFHSVLLNIFCTLREKKVM